MGTPVTEPEMQEDTMKQVQTPLKLMIAGTVVAAFTAVAPTASAQTAATTAATPTTNNADAFTVAPSQTFSKTGKPTSSTPKMVREAIQQHRRHARPSRCGGAVTRGLER